MAPNGPEWICLLCALHFSGKWGAALSVSLGPDLHELRQDAHSGHTITLNLGTWKVQVYLLCYSNKTRSILEVPTLGQLEATGNLSGYSSRKITSSI
ncbi:hypothetical protein N7524_008490 [Penicillium chrysogenum]|nr:hypothetical protein N7524_008490 [Penicillium chrysogenum]